MCVPTEAREGPVPEVAPRGHVPMMRHAARRRKAVPASTCTGLDAASLFHCEKARAGRYGPVHDADIDIRGVSTRRPSVR